MWASAPTGGPIAYCLLPRSVRGTRGEQCSPLQAGLLPIAYCLLPRPGRGTRGEQCSPLQAGLLPIAYCLVPGGVPVANNVRPYRRV